MWPPPFQAVPGLQVSENPLHHDGENELGKLWGEVDYLAVTEAWVDGLGIFLTAPDYSHSGRPGSPSRSFCARVSGDARRPPRCWERPQRGWVSFC